MKIVVVLSLVLFSCYNGETAKILAVFPTAAPSHYFLGNSLLKALAEKGHDVTMISPFKENNPPKNCTYRDIVLTGFVDQHKKLVKEMNIFDFQNKNFLTLLPFFSKMMLGLSEETLKHPNVQGFLKRDEKFDVVIVEQFMNEAHQAFAHHFNAPLILVSTIGANAWVNILVGNPSPPSYIPESLLNYSSNMTFTQRGMNSFVNLVNRLMHHFYLYPKQYELAQKYFPNPPKSADDMIFNNSLVLLNSHPSINQPVPYVPNMIDIGGFHVKPPKKLPEDLQQYLDNAKEGVIYFSLGSNIQSSMLPIEKREAILQAFSSLKLKVLWKWEEDELPGQPPNVKLGKWLPQQDILAHPNVKLFITHGGLLSTIETTYHGKPILAIPIAADQKLNAQRGVKQGIGLMVDYNTLSKDILIKNINELLTNPQYAENAKTRSLIFHDRQVKPLDTAIYWVEYVIRHRGAPHLRVAALDLSWYQYLLLDVIAFVTGVVLLSLVIFYSLVKFLCCRRKKGQKKEKTH